MKQTQCQTFLAMAMLDWKEVLIWDHLLGKYWAHSLAFLFLGLPCCACSSWAATRSSLGNTSAMLAKRCIKSNNFWTSWLQAHLFRHALDFSVGRISWDFFFTSSTRSSHPSTSLMRWCLKSCLHTFKQYWHEPPTKSASRSAPHTLQPATLFTLPPKPRGRSLGGVSNSSSAPSFNGVLTFCLLWSAFAMGLDWALGFDGIDSLDVEGLTRRVLGYQGSCQPKPIKTWKSKRLAKPCMELLHLLVNWWYQTLDLGLRPPKK